MQMIAEIYGILRDGLGMSAAIAPVFAGWNKGRSTPTSSRSRRRCSPTIDPKTGKPVRRRDPRPRRPEGHRRWSAIVAQELGVPATAIEAAVAARVLSSLKDERLAAEERLRQGRRYALRRQDGGRVAAIWNRHCWPARSLLRAGLCRDGRPREEFGWNLPLADHRQDLARRLHHPLALPRTRSPGLCGRRGLPTF